LIKAAENELITERETILKLRTLVQTKNTKLDQLKKKFLELQSASKARMILLEQERIEKQKLLDTIDHYKENLIEREDALAEKEKTVLELRSKTRTLENFRFVLDHRLQQLSAERGPITSHIEGWLALD
jgi:predicted Rossmann fold nucleotide-binding protein DprA/Smf involved in DNA uptake